MEPKKQICGLTPSEIGIILRERGADQSYSDIIAMNFYRRSIRDFSGMSNIPKPVRTLLSEIFSQHLISPVKSEVSEDETVKYLFSLPDGREFETVYIPDGKRNTVCVSTQAGCRMGCPFCVTGKYGFRGNLSAGEIVSQVISLPESEKINHIVFMGMGEPLDNLDEVLKACEIFTAQWGLALSCRNITVSTVGITKGVRRFLSESECNLTLSLFSPFSDERAAVVPAEKANPVRKIISMMRDFELKKKRRLTVACVMIKDINDTERHLNELKNLLRGTSIRVNLLPYHPAGDDPYSPSSIHVMNHFGKELQSEGISASVRRSRGSDISAACGLLAAGLKRET